MLALGFAGASRRSELVALSVEDLAEVPRVTIQRSKTDPDAQGQENTARAVYLMNNVTLGLCMSMADGMGRPIWSDNRRVMVVWDPAG